MTKCSVCGRELPGVELETTIKLPWKCAECHGELNNSLYCRRGDKVRFSFPTNGTKSSQLMAQKYLTVGNTYEVNRVQVYSSKTYIQLVEFPYWFNSVLFERL